MINYETIFTLLLFTLLFVFPLMIYLNIRKYRQAALGLLVSKKTEGIKTFKIFAVAMILYAVNMFTLIMVDITQIGILSMIYIILSIILAIILIYVFYKLYRITKV